MDAPLKKVVLVHGEPVELFSFDGWAWSSDVKQLEKRLKEKERELKRQVEYSRRIFPKRYLNNL